MHSICLGVCLTLLECLPVCVFVVGCVILLLLFRIMDLNAVQMANSLSAFHNTTQVCVAFLVLPQVGISINCLLLQIVFPFKSSTALTEGQFVRMLLSKIDLISMFT